MANGVNVAERYRGYAREGMSEQEIAAQADRELAEKRKEDQRQSRASRRQARAVDAATKADLRNRMIAAVGESAVAGMSAIGSGPKGQAKQTAKAAQRAGAKEARIAGKLETAQALPVGVQDAKVARLQTRATRAGESALIADLRAKRAHEYAYGDTKPYSGYGSLYGQNPGPKPPQPIVKNR
jgi:hypothetical protein